MANDKKKSDTSRALADIGHRLGGAFVVPDRGKMQAVVEAYKQEMLQWLTNGYELSCRWQICNLHGQTIYESPEKLYPQWGNYRTGTETL